MAPKNIIFNISQLFKKLVSNISSGATTFSIMTLSIMILSIMIASITALTIITLRTMTLSKMTLSIKILSITIKHCILTQTPKAQYHYAESLN
jgi:hypothetical protein